MKKLMTIALMVVAMTASAQGKWEKSVIEADELKGQEASVAYVYTQPGTGSFIMWGFDIFQYRLTSDEHQFDIESGYNQFAGSYSGIKVLVGLYDDNDKLLEKFTMWLDKEDNRANHFVKTRNAGGMSNPVGQKGKVKKIFKHLQSGKGYVRMVCPRFNTTDFDLKIPPFKLD